jgi:hypothetical protein
LGWEQVEKTGCGDSYLHILFSVPAPTQTTSFLGAQAIFQDKPFHVLYPMFPTAVTLHTYEDETDKSALKHWHLYYRHRGITQKKAHITQNMAKV